MKNLKKSCLSLAVVGALGISANAVSLQESLTSGKLSGEIRSVTVMSSHTESSEGGPNNNAKTSAIGLQLNYETADFNGFKAQVGFQTSHNLDLDDGDYSPANGFSGEKEGRAAAEGSNLYLANISYATGNTNIKVGKQLISTTLMSGSNTFPLRDSFHGLSIVNKDLPQTEVKFYVIKDWYERYHAEVGNSRATHFKKPTYSLYVKNNSIDNLTLEGQYLAITDEVGNPTDAPVATNDKYSTYYGAFTYKLPTSIPLSVGSFYAGADYDAAGNPGTIGGGDTSMFGVKLGGKLFNTGFKIAYTKVADDRDFIGNLGHVPNFFKYNGGQMNTDNFYAGVSSTSLMVIPKLIPGIFTLFAYSAYSQTDEGITNATRGHNMDGASEIQADLRYKFSGPFKGLSTRLQVSQIDFDDERVDDDKLTTARLYLNYKF